MYRCRCREPSPLCEDTSEYGVVLCLISSWGGRVVTSPPPSNAVVDLHFGVSWHFRIDRYGATTSFQIRLRTAASVQGADKGMRCERPPISSRPPSPAQILSAPYIRGPEKIQWSPAISPGARTAVQKGQCCCKLVPQRPTAATRVPARLFECCRGPQSRSNVHSSQVWKGVQAAVNPSITLDRKSSASLPRLSRFAMGRSCI